MVGQRLVRIDKHLSEYLLFQSLWALFKSRFTHHGRAHPAFDTFGILKAWEHLPPQVLRPERNRRPYLSGVLSRNEVDREYAWNRALFKRLRQGWYQFNPALAVRLRTGGEECWRPVFAVLNLPLVAESTRDINWFWLGQLAGLAQITVPDVPLAAECAVAHYRAKEELAYHHRLAPWVRAMARRQSTQGAVSTPSEVPSSAPNVVVQATSDRGVSSAAGAGAGQAASAGPATDTGPAADIGPATAASPAASPVAEAPKWGTPEARRKALEELRLRIEEH